MTNNDDLFLYIGTQLAGSTITLETAATPDGAARRKVPVKLAKYWVPGPGIATKKPPAIAGLRVDYTSIIGQRPPVPFGFRGHPAGRAHPRSAAGHAAEQARLQPEKVILLAPSTSCPIRPGSPPTSPP